MFRNPVRNAGFKRGTKNLLAVGLTILKRNTDVKSATKIKDYKGTIGYDTKLGIFVAKKETYGNIVSVSRQIWDLALKANKKILMYIMKSGYIYEFDPATIKDTQTNYRENIEMINFNIREGKNLLKTGLATFDPRTEDEKLKEMCQKYNL